VVKSSWGSKWCSHLDAEHIAITMELWGHATNRLTDEEMELGIRKSIALLDFPPSISQFKRFALDILPPEQAYNSIGINDLATKIWENLDSWLKRTGDEKDVKKAFIAAYNNLVEKLLLK
jgi:hypothetical protein